MEGHRGIEMELVEGEMSWALRAVLHSDVKKAAVVLRPDGHVRHGDIAVLPAGADLDDSDTENLRAFLRGRGR